ncbi:MAG: hypothetical protein DVS81_19780 [Candidatus Accumulibacter meliphilus]|jgi:hypothetical protein|uniref:Uncharacterized protein n=1 Tax=Candidatus Accumulibacter meliphilus TaxID=2211374 RepID=A0A369XHN7_9PROT|nr:MAG: hypothetical protein DVS81_19780 [Candidatus Accumulibacter meliphilus]
MVRSQPFALLEKASGSEIFIGGPRRLTTRQNTTSHGFPLSNWRLRRAKRVLSENFTVICNACLD